MNSRRQSATPRQSASQIHTRTHRQLALRQLGVNAPEQQQLTDSRHEHVSAAQWVVRCLERHGVTHVTGIPGGAILPLYDALAQSALTHVLARHEQGAAFIAQGMARATGRPGVTLATSGPGATNLVTALADAYADSVPLLAITAQVPRALIGTRAFQEVDTCALFRPVCKASFFASSAQELARLLPQALRLATFGRCGPVHIDVPKDVLLEKLPAATCIVSAMPLFHSVQQMFSPLDGVTRLDAAQSATWQHLAALIKQSRKPLLYVGGGVHHAGARDALSALLHRVDIPVVSSLQGLGAVASDAPHCLGMLGMHGLPRANLATTEADLVLAIGVRFDDRATGDVSRFCENARIVHIDVDPAELGRLKAIEFGICCDARMALLALTEHAEVQSWPDWYARLLQLEQSFPFVHNTPVLPFLRSLSGITPKGALVTTDVGQHQMWVAQGFALSGERSLLTSGGLGTMGFGLPAAIGAALACRGRKTLCISGDGSFLMNIQELATLKELELDVTIIVLHNGQLGMVRQQQDMFYGQRHSAAHFAERTDFVAIAQGFGISAMRVELHPENAESVAHRVAGVIQRPGPALVEVTIAGDNEVLPIVPAGCSNAEMSGIDGKAEAAGLS